MKKQFHHYTKEERQTIEEMLNQKASFAEIARSLKRAASTISYEVKNHRVFLKVGTNWRSCNECKKRYICNKTRICEKCNAPRNYKKCSYCSLCNRNCSSFEKEECQKLLRPPYVCNGCGKRMDCLLGKFFYKASKADEEARLVCSESRSGFSYSEGELEELDKLISPLLKNKQSPHHICATHKDLLTVSERTIYRLVDQHYFSAINMDLPRKVRMRPRRKVRHYKVDRKCRIGRTYDDFLNYLKLNPDTPVVQLDSVLGKPGSKVLLTIHFVRSEMMLAFLRDANNAASVTKIFNQLYEGLGDAEFKKIFRICLTDNGSEFSDPSAIELDLSGNLRTRIFYCNPCAPYQKGSAERNHEFIRYFIPKGTDLNSFTQEDITLMMNHINSYSRGSLGDKCPYDVFRFMYGDKLLNLLGCVKLPPQKVTLNKSVFRKEGSV